MAKMPCWTLRIHSEAGAHVSSISQERSASLSTLAKQASRSGLGSRPGPGLGRRSGGGIEGYE